MEPEERKKEIRMNEKTKGKEEKITEGKTDPTQEQAISAACATVSSPSPNDAAHAHRMVVLITID